MTDHERALLLFVAERLYEHLRQEAGEIPPYGWDDREPPQEWQEINHLSSLIDAVKAAAPRPHPRKGEYTTYDPARPWTANPIGDDGWWEGTPQWVKDHG